MSSLKAKKLEPMATEVWFDENKLYVRLLDGREISVPLEWFPKLINAKPEEKRNYRLIGKGIGIHWEALDEDISVEDLLGK